MSSRGTVDVFGRCCASFSRNTVMLWCQISNENDFVFQSAGITVNSTTGQTLLPSSYIPDTPRNWNLIHTISWVLNLFGIFFILAAHEHYSIDVFIAFYITTRLFLYYHTLANTRAYQHSRRARIWFPMFSFFECNVNGPVPNQYHWPFDKPAFMKTLIG